MTATVLIVDDEPDVRILCKVNLEYEGYRVLEANNGIEGLEIANREKPDLILLDLMMPEMDGWEMMQRLKENEKTALIPVVLLTAKTDDNSQVRGWAEGIIDYVTKPFNPLTLSTYVEKALKQMDPVELSRRKDLILEQLRFRSDLRRQEEKDGA